MEHLNLDKDFIPRSAMDNWNDFLNWKKPWELLLINSNKIGFYSNHIINLVSFSIQKQNY